MPELTLPALRTAVESLAPSRLPGFIEEAENAIDQAEREGSVIPLHMFYRWWAQVVEIERHPETARRLHAAEQAMGEGDADVRDRAVHEIGAILATADRAVEHVLRGPEPTGQHGQSRSPGTGRAAHHCNG